MKKRVLTILMAMALVVSGCSSIPTETDETSDTSEKDNSEEKNEKKEENTQTEVTEKSDENNEASIPNVSSAESLLGDSEIKYYDENLVPSIPSYKVNEDFSNIVYEENLDYIFNLENQNEYNDVKELRESLIKNNFAVVRYGADEFFDIYEGNRYNMYPSFVTVDSLMHTYHLYFAYLMKQSEKTYLSDTLKTLTSDMLNELADQYEQLKGTDFEKAALRNLAFFNVGNMLLDENAQAPINNDEFISMCKDEYDKIMSAQGIGTCLLNDKEEDYTQYKPRGYYDGDEQLEHYFRAMMWYGRIPFVLDNEDMVKSALLQTIAISKHKENWESIYKITSFFAGKSDDTGFYEFSELVNDIYGKEPEVSELSDTSKISALCESAKKLNPPAINSIPVEDGENPVIVSYRFMGQRFTIDAAIMQRLVYSSVGANSNGDNRYLPDTLDTAAALGSEAAMTILEKQGDTEYKNYTDNLQLLKEHFNNDEPSLWNASLYAGWLNTLRPLFEKKGEGYPSYMQNDEWEKKNLETFAGSYAELKHDTILYAKQVMAEMGGGDEEVYDDRGYVDPQPVIYSRFKFLSEKTKEGLEGFGMLETTAKEDLEKLSEIAGTLLTISEKELRNEALTDDEYEFIRCYGGYLEHFWMEVNKDKYDGNLVYSYQAPCPVVADIATNPNGEVLEVGSGDVDLIYVVFPIDGELHVARGSAYSFYQFTVPMADRMTDEEFQRSLSGGYIDDDYNWVEYENKPEQPEWTNSYRIGKR